MNLRTLVDKINDGTKLLLMIPTVIFKNRDEILLIESNHVISDYEQGRPDLIAARYYGDPSGLDIILKYNNISDPFSIKSGEQIKIPIREAGIKRFERSQTIDENIVKQQFIDTKRLSKKDQKRVKALQKKYGKENLLPPNVIPVGKKNYKFEKGNIVFGKQAQTDAVAEQIQSDINTGLNPNTETFTTNLPTTEQINNDSRIIE